MRKLLYLVGIVFLFNTNIYSQIFYQESFESTTGWNLSHSFDNGNNKFIKRDNATAFPGFEFILFGNDGDYLVGAENTDANIIGAPESGLAILEMDEISIAGKTNLQLVVSLACNDGDQSYDDRTFADGDFLDFDIRIDSEFWTTVARFNSAAGSNGNSGLYHDINNNSNGGEIGEAPITSVFTDFVIPINDTGSNIQVRARFKMTGSTEEIAIDNIRLRENTIDDTKPSINHVSIIDAQTIKVFFNESMSTNATQTSSYTGISNLGSVSLENSNMEAVLHYSSPLVIGTEYNLVIFGLQDEAMNSMNSPYSQLMYFNNTQPDLVITEIMYNDPNPADSLEFIEVYNNGSSPIQLGGLKISAAVDFTFPSMVLNAGEYYLIARKDVPASSFYNQNFGNYSGSLPNSEANIVIKNTQGNLIDLVHYKDQLPWPPAGDGSGASITLVDYNSNNNLGNNWIASSNGVGFVNGEAVYASPGSGPSNTLPEIQFLKKEYMVNETDGNVQISMNISASNTSASSVNLSWVAGGTADNSDLSLNGNETITFAPGLNSTVSFNISITNDILEEGFEYITLEIESINNANIGLKGSTNILINDDDYTPPTLFINEIQSVNQTDIVDENAQHEDWIEIYNPNSFPVNIAGYFITDINSNYQKSRIQYTSNDAIIAAESWLVLWADKDLSQGPLHINLKLNSLGELIKLIAPDGITVIDGFTFPALNIDQTYGRETDGGAILNILTSSTPNSSNDPDGIEELENSKIIVYPNPTKDYIYWGKTADVSVSSIDGKILMNSSQVDKIDLSSLQAGIYTITLDGGSWKASKNIIIESNSDN